MARSKLRKFLDLPKTVAHVWVVGFEDRSLNRKAGHSLPVFTTMEAAEKYTDQHADLSRKAISWMNVESFIKDGGINDVSWEGEVPKGFGMAGSCYLWNSIRW